MAMAPEEIERRVFRITRRGYDPDEVQTFLYETANALRTAYGAIEDPPLTNPKEDVEFDVEIGQGRHALPLC